VGATGAGSTGATGPSGTNGSTGATGPQGIVGGITYAVTNAGTSAYTINSTSNPTLNLIRGFTYYFNINATGHPFWIKTVQVTGTGSAYSSGVTNNGAQSGTITFTVPLDAPATLYYICQFHAMMAGTFNITDSGSVGPQGATGAAGTGSTGATGAVVITGNTYTVQTLYASTLTISTLSLGTIQSGNDLALKAAGQITVNAPFVLTTATTAQLTTIGGTTQRGAMVYVIDATGGAQPCYFSGTNWFTVNGRTQIA
jgi:hypothetical protein